jgi:hypothetical protein
MGIVSSIVQGGYVRRSQNPKRLITQGLSSCCVGSFLLSRVNTVQGLYIGSMCLAFTSGTVVTALTLLESGLEGKNGDQETGKKYSST